MRTIPLGLTLIAIIVAAVMAIALEARAQSDVPAIAQDEIARRGNHVEMTGTIRSGLMAAALSPPADDSAKWFLTLILRPGDAASERMRATVAQDPAMRPWVDAQDPRKSTLHYQVRSVDDPTQADWLVGLRPAIQRLGVPLLVLQPPRNGQFGETTTIVKLLSGVISGDELSRKLREAIIHYVRTIETPGISQSSIGVPPPFAPRNPEPVQPAVPFEFPPAPATVPPNAPPNPSEPATPFPTTWLALTAFGSFVGGWISAWLKNSVAAKVVEFNRVLNQIRQSGPNA